jgi:hypothetical protein
MSERLPEKIEAEIIKLCWYCLPYRADEHPNYVDAANDLRQAIRAALDAAHQEPQ